MLKYEKKPHPQDIMTTEKFILTVFGIYPQTKKAIVYYVALILTTLLSFGLFLTMTIKLVFVSEISIILEILYYLPQQTAYVFKLINFIYNGKKMYKIEEILNSKMFNIHNEGQYDFLNDTIYKSGIIAKIFRILCCLVVLFYALPSLIHRHFKMPFPAWFPFDAEKYIIYIYFLQIVSVAISATANSTIDLLNVQLISMGTAQLNVLIDNLKKVIHEDELKNLNKIQLDDIVEKRLKIAAKHHQTILEYCVYVENTFTLGILAQFVLSMIVICMTGFNILLVSVKSMEFVLLIAFFSCMTTQVAIYCWYGNNILVKSVAIADACYSIKWHECSPKIGKILFIIMERTKRPIKLTAGYFFTLSLTTFMMIVRSSYSYFAVLQRIYTENDD